MKYSTLTGLLAAAFICLASLTATAEDSPHMPAPADTPVQTPIKLGTPAAPATAPSSQVPPPPAAPVAAPTAPAPAAIAPTSQNIPTALKIYAKEKDGKIADNLQGVNERCGSKIAIATNWPSFVKADYDHYSVSGYCNAAVDAIGMVCADNDEYKNSVAAKIKTFQCSYGADRAVNLSNGSLNFTVNFKSVNDLDFVKSYLKSAL